MTGRTIDVAIVGAGFAGLYALYRMRRAGLTAHVFEAADDVGGVWQWNRYPGARCDVESLEYSYSFSAELDQEWDWSERYATQPEILRYLRHVAERFDLRRDISFSTRVHAAIHDDNTALWRVTTDRGEMVHARFCIMASGSLSAPRLPDVLGIETFSGEIFHTGAWPRTGVEFAGKTVAVIGTGSSGVQAIPRIADQAARVIVLQRTPSFVVPARNRTLDATTLAERKADYPALRKRAKMIGTFYDFSETPTMSVPAAERQAEFARRWDKGGVNFVHAFSDVITDAAANHEIAEFVRARVREVVSDPGVADRLCPTGYPLGTKRICVGADYYETFNRANVELVDLRATPVMRIDCNAIHTTEAAFDVDMIVCATGYDALTGALAKIDVRGRGGMVLLEKWAAGPRNYLGLMSADFPNLFIVTGPGSPSVLVNMVIGIEQHVDWIADCIAHLDSIGAKTIEPAIVAEDDWVTHVNAEADRTLFVKAASWYNGANVPGKPRVFMPFVGGIGRYRAICDQVAAEGYDGFEIDRGRPKR